jgi:DNA-binding CsgD family transcriptional regulator/sugar-specific transcriptional regulator TrmB
MSESFEILPTGGKSAEIDLAVYLWIIKNRCVELVDIASALNVEEREVRASYDRLLDAGLISGNSNDPSEVFAIDPRMAIARLAGPIESQIRRDQRRVIKIQDELERFSSHYQSRRGFETDAFEAIDTVKEVREALNRMAEYCTEEMISCQPQGGARKPEAMQEALHRDTRLLERGVSIRTIYQHAARFNGPSQAYVAMLSALGAQYRTVHQAFGQLIAFDRSVAFIPRLGGSSGAIIVREPSTVAFLCDFFERTWEGSTPFTDAASQGLERVSQEIQETILQLLAAGHKDSTIARRLGMSPRTIRRHIANIMEDFNVTSRFQAGVAAATSGMLAAVADPDKYRSA